MRCRGWWLLRRVNLILFLTPLGLDIRHTVHILITGFRFGCKVIVYINAPFSRRLQGNTTVLTGALVLIGEIIVGSVGLGKVIVFLSIDVATMSKFHISSSRGRRHRDILD